jgi:hypothetical protein
MEDRGRRREGCGGGGPSPVLPTASIAQAAAAVAADVGVAALEEGAAEPDELEAKDPP